LSGGGAPPSARRGVHGLAHPIGDLYERLRGSRRRIGDDDRLSLVAGLQHAWVEWYLTEQRELQCRGETLATSRTEQCRWLAAMRALEPTHVLDDAQYRHVHALEHLCTAERVTDGHFLWSRYYDRAIHIRRLHQRQLCVAG